MSIGLDPSMFPDTVEVIRMTRTTDEDGGVVLTPGDPEEMAASVQPYAASPVNAQRVVEHSRITGRTAWVVYTMTDPNVATDDTFTYRDKTLVANGPAAPDPTDDSGDPPVWGTDCMERA